MIFTDWMVDRKPGEITITVVRGAFSMIIKASQGMVYDDYVTIRSGEVIELIDPPDSERHWLGKHVLVEAMPYGEATIKEV